MVIATICCLLLGLSFVLPFGGAQSCSPRYYYADSFVCVCTDNYCDQIGQIDLPELGSYLMVTSSKDEFRFHKTIGHFLTNLSAAEDRNRLYGYQVSKNNTYQNIVGFGGAFTDSAGLNILSMNEVQQDHILRSYFGSEGIQYNMGRVPIGGSDFSTRPYSYCDTPDDVNLTTFSLTDEDHHYKIPLIHRSQEMSPDDLWLFGSPWAPPPWMKSNGDFEGAGYLLPPYWQPWAEYFVKFLDAYTANNVTFWGLTAQNEPLQCWEGYEWNCLSWNATSQRDWVRDHLGPTLERHAYSNIQLMIHDDQRVSLPEFPQTVLADPETAKYVAGIAVHWYIDFLIPAQVLTDTHNLLPDYFLLYTESCEGYLPLTENVKLGSWNRANSYAVNILQDLLNWVSGWVDWNLVLNMDGGPNWAGNLVDAPIIVNPTANEFYKQPMYYAMGHFSKFLPRGTLRIGMDTGPDAPREGITIGAFMTPRNSLVVEIINSKNIAVSVSIHDPEIGTLEEIIPPHSITTITWSTIVN